MVERSDFVEWDEPPRSPENRGFYVPYGEFIRLVSAMLLRLLALVAVGLAALFLVFVIMRHRSPVRMALWGAAFPLAMLLVGVVLCHAGYAFTFYVKRRVRVSRSDISYVTLRKRSRNSFADVARVWIEPADGGDRRLVIDGPRGELCRLRVPSGVDVESLARLIPEGKLERRDPAPADH